MLDVGLRITKLGGKHHLGHVRNDQGTLERAGQEKTNEHHRQVGLLEDWTDQKDASTKSK